MSLQIRPSTFADSPALAELLRAAQARRAASASELKRLVGQLREHPVRPHFHELLAEDRGRLVGHLMVYQNVGRFHPGHYDVEIAVHPDAQGRGLGRRLAQEAQAHLSALNPEKLLSGTYEHHERGLAFLAQQGFTERFRYFDNVLDLRTWKAERWPVPALGGGLRLLTLADLIAEQGEEAAWRAFHAAFAEARQDAPSEEPPAPTLYEVFRQRAQAPGYSPQSVFLAVTGGGEVVAVTELKTDPQDAALMHIGLTGTRRAWRRRGLALALKLAGMHWAQASGARHIKTGNATSNAAILAINGRLGFRPERVRVEFARTL